MTITPETAVIWARLPMGNLDWHAHQCEGKFFQPSIASRSVWFQRYSLSRLTF